MSIIRTFILKGRTPVPCSSIENHTAWMAEANRIVAGELLPNGIHVSTVFTGIDQDHSVLPHAPMVFETKVFGGDNDGFKKWYRTWEGAEAGHKRICEQLQKGEDLIAW